MIVSMKETSFLLAAGQPAYQRVIAKRVDDGVDTRVELALPAADIDQLREFAPAHLDFLAGLAVIKLNYTPVPEIDLGKLFAPQHPGR
jgi:hypothetical protein